MKRKISLPLSGSLVWRPQNLLNNSVVIPANPRESGGESESTNFKDVWMPAFAGMTGDANDISNELTLIRQNILSSERSSSLTSLYPWRLCRKDENSTFVILNKVKNLMHSIRYTTQILRPRPQNDIATQSLAGES